MSLSNLRPGVGVSSTLVASGAESRLSSSSSESSTGSTSGAGAADNALLPRGKSARLLQSILSAAREPMLAVETKVDMELAEPRVRVAKVIGLNEAARRVLDSFFPNLSVEWVGRDLVAELRWLELRNSQRMQASDEARGSGELRDETESMRLGKEALSCLVEMMVDTRPRSFSLPAVRGAQERSRLELFASRLKEWSSPLQIISMRQFSVPSADQISQTHGLLARFAHEIRSPLTSVVLAFQQLARLAHRSEAAPDREAVGPDLLELMRPLVEIGKVESEKCRSLAQSWLDPVAMSRGDFLSPAGSGVGTANDLELLDFRELVEKSFGSRVRVQDHTMGSELLCWGRRETVEFAMVHLADALRNEIEVLGVEWSASLDADARVRQIQFRTRFEPRSPVGVHDADWRELDSDLISYRLQGDDGSLLWWSILKWRDLLVTWGWRTRVWVHPEVQMPQVEIQIPMF